jgi:hypothetical protein
VNTPEGKRFFAAYGSKTGSMTAADFADFVKQELKRWEGIFAMTGPADAAMRRTLRLRVRRISPPSLN